MLIDNRDFGWDVTAGRAVKVGIQYSIITDTDTTSAMLAAIGIMRAGEDEVLPVLTCITNTEPRDVTLGKNMTSPLFTLKNTHYVLYRSRAAQRIFPAESLCATESQSV